MELRKYKPVARPQDIWSELGLPVEDAKLREQVAIGFSVNIFNSLASVTGMHKEAMREALKISPTTLNRRRIKGCFTMKESDRIYSLIETVSRATDLFDGDRKSAVEWMNKEAFGLGNKRPIDMLDSHANTQAVLEFITRLEYGVYS